LPLCCNRAVRLRQLRTYRRRTPLPTSARSRWVLAGGAKLGVSRRQPRTCRSKLARSIDSRLGAARPPPHSGGFRVVTATSCSAPLSLRAKARRSKTDCPNPASLKHQGLWRSRQCRRRLSTAPLCACPRDGRRIVCYTRWRRRDAPVVAPHDAMGQTDCCRHNHAINASICWLACRFNRGGDAAPA